MGRSREGARRKILRFGREAGDWGVVGGAGGVGVYSIFMHGRCRMTIDARIPTMPARSTSGFHRPGRHCLHQVRSAVRCSASRMKGELHPAQNRFLGGLRLLVRTFLDMDDSLELIKLFSGVASSTECNGYTM